MPTSPQCVTSVEELFWGGTLVAITMVLHGFGMLGVLRTSGFFKLRFEPMPTFTKGMILLVVASWMILLVRLIEVFARAGFFLWTDAVNTTTEAKANASLCYDFALMDYTTLGSSYNLHLRWRLLEGMIAVAGLLTFAWSTGIMLTLAREFQDQQMSLLKQKRVKHGPAGARAGGEPVASLGAKTEGKP
ncbi:MAG TPA: hypothetical protein VMB80_09485 [Candidatus Acidoferrum sp.]|nr:hypothetical protein [Candidatus Acidoferrum sp.]